MKLSKILKKKIFYPYIIFAFLAFIVLFSINLIYTKHVLGLNMGNKYVVSAIQYQNYKYNTYGELFAKVFDEKIKIIHRIKGVNVEEEVLTLKKSKSRLNFTLILSDYVEEEKLNTIVNQTYKSSLNEVLNDLKNNKSLYDYYKITNEYKKLRSIAVNKTHDELIKSKFFKKYPYGDCNQNEEKCLEIYRNYYSFILSSININEEQSVKGFLNLSGNEEISITDIFRDFANNKHLFSGNELLNLNDSNKNDYFDKHLYKLVNSTFFHEYNFEYCTGTEKCLRDIHDKFSKLKFYHELENKNLYEIKYIKPKEKREFYLLLETLKILGFVILITYILFVFTNKFLRTKLK